MGSNSALGGIRVLDLADPKGIYSTKLLADLGADVIKIEPIDGDPTRKIPPFYKDAPGLENSLYWWHFNTNKRSITLDIEKLEGRQILKKLALQADIIVETYPPGYLAERDLSYENLKEIKPGLVVTSITGFGQTGPWKDYKTSDLIALALGGLLFVCGWPDLPPQRMGGSQAYNLVSADATLATLLAYYHSMMTGQGQHVDVSMHQAIPRCLQTRSLIYKAKKDIQFREGDEHPAPLNGIFPCKDGYVDFRFLLARWDTFVDWLNRDSIAYELKEEKWRDPQFRRQESNQKRLDEVFRAFLMIHTKKEIYEEGQRRGLVVGSVNDPSEVARDPQLVARNYFADVEHPELGVKIKYLGPPFKLSRTPCKISRRSPFIGEHNDEVYLKELGMSQQELDKLKKQKVV